MKTIVKLIKLKGKRETRKKLNNMTPKYRIAYLLHTLNYEGDLTVIKDFLRKNYYKELLALRIANKLCSKSNLVDAATVAYEILDKAKIEE